MLANTSYTSASVLQCLMKHAQRYVESHSCFTLHSAHRGGAFAAWPQAYGTFEDIV